MQFSFFFFSSRRRHTRFDCDWSSDVCSSDLACSRHLLTSYGLRSLAPGHSQYQGRYGGDQRARDGAYHQGTVWGWLLGPFALAHFRVHRDAVTAGSFLAPLADHLGDAGLGSISEIFDGDPPFTPVGCIAQAWSVAETLRAWHELSAG